MKDTVIRGFVGTSAPLAAWTVSKLAEIEAWLRVVSLLCGIAVALVTIWGLLRKKK